MHHPNAVRPATALLTLAACLLPGTAVMSQSLASQAPLAPADIFELEWASDPQVSPNGRRVAYVRNGFDIMTDRRLTQLWSVDAVSGVDRDGEARHRPLTSSEMNASSPRWSPNGDRLAFVGHANGQTQIFVRWSDSGQIARLSRLQQSPSALAWSPDGKMLAFVMSVAVDVSSAVDMPKRPEGAEWAPAPRVIDELLYRADGRGYLEPSHDHVFVLPADGGTPRQLTQGDFDHSGPLAWGPDAKTLVVSANRHGDWQQQPQNSELYEVSVGGGTIRPLTDRVGPDAAPTMSPDGEWIAWTGYDDRFQGYQIDHLYVMRRDGSQRRALTTELDRAVASPRWSADSRRLFFSYSDHGVGKVGAVDLDGRTGVVAEHVGGTSLGRPYASGSFSVGGPAGGGEVVAFTITSTERPADIAVVRGSADRATTLTRLNEDLLAQRCLAPVEELSASSSHDGRPIQAWLARSPDCPRAGDISAESFRPLILEIHGGPFADYGWRWSAEVQLYAAAGYDVLYLNPRGSSGYGEAFGNLIHHAYPGYDYDDLMSAVDAAIADGGIDADQLFVTGGSGGGVLTAWIVGKTDRFRAAVSAKPVINWFSFALTADAYNFFYRYWFPGLPWDHAQHYFERSPISLVGNVTTPTMLLTGEQDYRTPISETEQYYQALKLRQVDTQMVRIPEASHGITARPSHLIAKVAHILDWFERYR